MDDITLGLLRWAPLPIRSAASLIGGRRDELRVLTDRLRDVAHLAGWEGAAADAARADLGVVLSRFQESMDDADAVRGALDAAADLFDPLWPHLLAGNVGAVVGRFLATEDSLAHRLNSIDMGSAAERDVENRRLLLSERERLEKVAIELRETLRNNRFGGLFSNADAGLEQTEKRLRALDAIQAVLDKGGRQLLVLDNSGEKETMAAIGVGDVDTAANVAVFVPGLGSTVQGNMDTYDSEVAGIVGPGDAGVTWLGYEAPQLGWGLIDPEASVLSGRCADAAGDALASFLDGLPTDPHLTVVGHSYGSLVAVEALESDTRVDDVVLLGSPGVGVTTAADINADHVYVIESPTDPVADTAWFGRDPNFLPGADVLSSSGADGHGQYLDFGTGSATNVAAVVSGAPTTPARMSVDAGDVVRVLLGIAF